LIRVNSAGLKALRQLALDRDTTLQALGIALMRSGIPAFGF
jgi:hypothetical protein